jgi:hypothetical protein
VHRKICRRNDHEQKHDSERSEEKLERRLGNHGFAGFARLCHGFKTMGEPVCSEKAGILRSESAEMLRRNISNSRLVQLGGLEPPAS